MVSDPFILIPLGILAALLIFASICDIKTRIIENWVSYAIAATAPLFWWGTGLSLWPDVAIQIALSLAAFAFFCIWFALRQMGGADVKLATALALWLPPSESLVVWLVMAIAGGIISIIAWADHKWRKKEGPLEVPYAVAIAFAGLWWAFRTIS